MIETISDGIAKLTKEQGKWPKGTYIRLKDMRILKKKCPECGSTNIKGITCQNCGYEYFIWDYEVTEDVLVG